MALMKKLQPGGTVDQNILNDAINQELSHYSLKSKDERKVRDALVQLRDYMATPEGKSFSVDPVAKTFTVSGEGAEKFQGSPDKIKSGWLTGKLKIKDNQDAMSIAASIYNNALSSSKKSSPVSTTQPSAEKGTLGIEELSDYTWKRRFGGEKGFTYHYGQLKNDDEVKQFIYDSATDLLKGYKERFAKTPDAYKPENAANIAEVEKAIASKNWEGFLNASTKLGWDPYSLLRTDEQKQAAAEKEKQATATAAVDLYKKAGLGENVQNYLYQQGFTQQADQNWTPDKGATWFKDVLAKNKASVWYNPTTKKHTVVTANGLFDYGMQDQLHPGYGFSWRNDQEGFHWYTPGQYSQNAGVWKADQYGKENIGRELITNLPGAKVYGWSAQDESGNYAKDVLGRRDFTKQLQVEQNGHKYTLTKDDKGIYRDQQGRVVNLQIKGFGGTRSEITDWTRITRDPNNILSIVPKAQRFNSLQEALTDLTSVKQEIQTQGTFDEDKIKNIVSHLKYIIESKAPQQEKEQALKSYAELKQIVEYNKIPLNKKGGVLKAQKGMSFNEYIKKYNVGENPQGSQLNTPDGKPAVSSKGMLKNMNAWDALSLAGTAASFVPGVGAIGGGVTTIADIASDIQKDGFQASDIFNWNTAANLGFTALAFFGLGGLKSIQVGAKAAKAAKAVDLAINVGKAAEKAAVIEKAAIKAGMEIPEAVKATKRFTEVVKGIDGGENLLKTLAKGEEVVDLAKLTPEAKTALESAGYLTKEGTIAKDLIQADMGMSHGVQKAITNEALLKGKEWVVDPAKYIGKQAIKGGEFLLKNDKVRKGAGYAMMGLGAKDAMDMISSYNEAPENLSFAEKLGRIKVEDLKGAMILGALSAQKIRELKDAKALATQTVRDVVEEEAHTIKIGDKTFNLSGTLPAEEKSTLLEKAKKIASKKPTSEELAKTESESLDKLKKDIREKIVGDENKLKFDEAVKDKNLSQLKEDLKSYEYKAKKEGGIRLKYSGDDPTSIQNTLENRRRFQRAKDILEKDINSRGNLKARPDWLGGENARKYKAKLYEEPQPEEVFDIKNIKKIEGKGKSSDIDRMEKINKYLDERKLRPENKVIPKTSKRKPAYKSESGKPIKKTKFDENNQGIIPFKEGGILKFAVPSGPLPEGMTSEKSYGYNDEKNPNWNKPVDLNKYIPYGKFENNDWRNTGGNYSKDYLDFVGNEENWNKYKGDIQTGIQNAGSNYIIKDYADYKRLATDNMPGPVHNVTMSMIQRMAPISGKITGLTVAPVTIPTKLEIPKIGPTQGSGKTVQGNPKGSGNPFILPDLTEWLANKKASILTDLANQKAGNEQRQAVADSMYTIPYQQQQYIRATAPYSLLGEREAGKIQSQAGRIAAATSDINKSIGVQLSGVDKANEIRTKMGMSDQERLDKTRMEQDAANAKVSAANTQILWQNRANTSQAFKNIHLINSNETLQRTANKVAETKGDLAFLQKVRDEEGRMKMFNFYNDPKYRDLANQYNELKSDKYIQDLKTNWEKNKSVDDKTVWEQSKPYKDLQVQIKGLEDKLTPRNNMYQQVSLGRSLGISPDRMNILSGYGYQPGQPISYPNYNWMGLFRSGGSVTGADRIEMEKIKADSRKSTKELEMFYKSILHDSEMLQKTLIKVFK